MSKDTINRTNWQSMEWEKMRIPLGRVKHMPREGYLWLHFSCWHCGSSCWLAATPRGFPMQVICLQLLTTMSLCCHHGNPVARSTSTISYFLYPSECMQWILSVLYTLPFYTSVQTRVESGVSTQPSLCLIYATLHFHSALAIVCCCRATLWGFFLPHFQTDWNPSLVYF